MERTGGALLAAVLAAGAAHTEERVSPSAPCAECVRDRTPPVLFTWGGSLAGRPFGKSLSVGIVFPDIRRLGAPLLTGTRWLVQVEAGEGAGALRVGTAAVINLGPRWRPIVPVAGVGLSASVLRTWGVPAPTRGRTYVGVEAHLTLLAFRLRGGRHLALNTGEGRSGFWSWGLGIGF